jgi:hypothetical protein
MSDREAFEKWAEDKSFILCVSSGDGLTSTSKPPKWHASEATNGHGKPPKPKRSISSCWRLW